MVPTLLLVNLPKYEIDNRLFQNDELTGTNTISGIPVYNNNEVLKCQYLFFGEYFWN